MQKNARASFLGGWWVACGDDVDSHGRKGEETRLAPGLFGSVERIVFVEEDAGGGAR